MRIATQMDTLTQVIHRRQVLFPQGIKRLQHDAFFEVTHHLCANHFFFALIHVDGLRQNTLTQCLFMQFWFFIQPFCDRHLQIEVIFQAFLQTRDIPHFFQRLRRNVGINRGFEHVFTNAVDGFTNVAYIQQFVTLGIDRTTLIVGNIIVFQQLLTNIEVAAFHFTLRVSNRFGDPRVLNGLTRFHPQFTHHAGHAVRGKNTHQRIFH
ncbi:hypothetical protein SDC9_113368 [bioreactor metagenome]|uniref:Uncharacterized protein n=1 Tax=bioreactor metagenome TaxID=1076179 RepID=A0A645BPF1_9ZZZZ